MAKSKVNGKIVAGVLALAIAGGAVCAAGIGSSENGKWFQNGNIPTWFNGWGHGVHPNISGDTGDGSCDIGFSDSENNGIEMFVAKIPRVAYAANGVSERAQVAYTVTAELHPSSAENKKVDWALVYDDDGTPVTSKVELSIPSDGSLTVTLICTEAFPDRVMKLICTSRDSGASGSVRIRCEGLPTEITVNGAAAIADCRWGNTNTYSIELDNALNYVGDAQYDNLTVKSLTLYGTIQYYDEVFYAGVFGDLTKTEGKGSSWSSGGATYQLSEKYPNALKATISNRQLILTMSAYPSATCSRTNVGTSKNGSSGTMYYNYYSAPQDAYADIVLKTGTLETTFRISFKVGVTGISLGNDIVF